MPPDQQFLMAIDQGTSSSRTVIFDQHGAVVASAQEEFPQEYPQPGWVEHDPEAIWLSVLNVSKQALEKSGCKEIAALGITNQRETTLIWDRQTGKCVHHAIVWQDRRTADYCAELKGQGLEAQIREKTGLRLDPYFSATKIAWIMEHVPGARELAAKGRLAFGTIDSFLLWRLTNGKVHATDASNASRTLLFNIHTQEWDESLLDLFNIPRALLPDVMNCADNFGVAEESLFGQAIPICGMAGDQQAALIGQAGLAPGMTKSTYGTGCFVIANTGSDAPHSKNNLLTTVAYRLDGKVTYGLEGSIFVAGSAIQWLRDQLKVIESAADCEAIATENGIVDHVHVIPAFAGLGAPYWDANARAAILGLSRDSGIAEIVTATLQAVAYQTRDLLDAMQEDGLEAKILRVDGGMVANNWFLQFLADILGVPVERPANVESTVLGVAYLAGVQSGVFESFEQVANLWSREAVFEPTMQDERREQLYCGWQAAVRRVRSEA